MSIRDRYKDDPEELQAAMRRHTSMFNTNCDWGSIIHGITISLEEQRALDVYKRQSRFRGGH